jgi:hypothetical protein
MQYIVLMGIFKFSEFYYSCEGTKRGNSKA